MNKAELIEAIVTKAGLSKKAAKEAVDAMIYTISKTICDGEPVQNHGLRDVRATPAQVQGWGQPADQAADHSRLAGRAGVPSWQ
jgi:hypothetical protein